MIDNSTILLFSVSMAKTNWDPYSGNPPPPPPPPKSLINQKTKPPVAFPPPPSRTSSAASRSLSSSSSASLPPPLPSRGQSGPPPPPPRGTAVPPALPVIRPQPNPLPTITSGPPPIVRSTRPDFHARPKIPKPPTTSSDTEIDWSNLSPEDKAIFFSWLDEFFTNFTPPSINRDAAVAHRPAIPASSHALPLQSSVSYICHL